MYLLFQDLSMNIYVGNLPYSTSEEDIKDLFSEYGEVSSVKFIKDRDTGRFRGFGFVEMEDEGAQQAIDNLNNSEFHERNLVVNEAREKTQRRRDNRKRF